LLRLVARTVVVLCFLPIRLFAQPVARIVDDDGNSGYAIAATGLPPGSYLLVVYAHSTVTHTFGAVQTVAIMVPPTH
jgi:hypothetical protein